MNSYQIFSDFSDASFGALSLAGYDREAYRAAISDAGLLTFAVVPEPATSAVLAGALALGIVPATALRHASLDAGPLRLLLAGWRCQVAG